MIRVAMISFWHVHAKDYARQAIENAETEIVAAWDEEAGRGREQAQALGVPFYEHLDDLLAQSDIDGVIVNTPTTMHHTVIIAAARAGKHVFTEKVIAPALHECNEILGAIEQAGVKLTVSLPRLRAAFSMGHQRINFSFAIHVWGQSMGMPGMIKHSSQRSSQQLSSNGWDISNMEVPLRKTSRSRLTSPY